MLTLVAAAADGSLLPARWQMAMTLGSHIVLACFGVAFPVLIGALHLRGVRRGDDVALGLARRWSKVAALLFAVGAVSGTVLSFEMGMLWPAFMERYGEVIGVAFAIEGLAFFTEAIFLGIYLHGWGRLPPRAHLLTLVPIAVSGVVGSYCVVSVNAWMNRPTGFREVDGVVVDVDPAAALFNVRSVLQFAHMWVGAFVVVGFVVGAVYAAGLLRGRDDPHHRLGFRSAFAMAAVAALVQPFLGHVLGLRLYEDQPSKLAAIELATETEAHAPLVVGGVLVDGERRFGIEVPDLGSLIARGGIDREVPGFDQVPAADRLPDGLATMVHWSFQAMVGLGLGLAALGAGFWVLERRGRDLLAGRWFLRTAVLAGAGAVAALELGWITTEVGRQPWIAYGRMRVTEAIGDGAGAWWSFAVVLVVYVGMLATAGLVLRSMARRWRAEDDAGVAVPYGPPAPEAVGP